jgi:hypothetical protein
VGKQIKRVLVAWAPRALEVTVLIRPSYPSASTPPAAIGGNPPAPVCAGIGVDMELRLVLPRPVGSRAVLDGAYYPAAPVHLSRRRGSFEPARTVVVR